MNLLNKIKSCSLCKDCLPLPPKPIVQFERSSEILIIGQAPGIHAHDSGIPWNDKSGERLRLWLGVPEEIFYDPKKVAIIPMGFCYPGKAKTGDLPPRPECARTWMPPVLRHLKKIRMKILIGKYAADHFIGKGNLSDKIKEYSQNDSPLIVLPHPSPRNNIWLAKNKWFLEESLPLIQKKMHSLGFPQKV